MTSIFLALLGNRDNHLSTTLFLLQHKSQYNYHVNLGQQILQREEATSHLNHLTKNVTFNFKTFLRQKNDFLKIIISALPPRQHSNVTVDSVLTLVV